MLAMFAPRSLLFFVLSALAGLGLAAGSEAVAADGDGFIGGLVNSVTGGSAGIASEKEACFTCQFVLRKAYIIAGKELAASDDIAMAISAVCDNSPPVFGQGCESLVELKKRVSQDLVDGKAFDQICKDAQLCWPGLMGGIMDTLKK
jgi:hypothetical protein